MNIEDIFHAARRPERYEPGEELWNDAHISRGMLAAHLAPDTDAASYRPKKIAAICEYLRSAMGLNSGDSVVDLGCGPGLYCARLAAGGIVMTGIARSENSIRYAREHNSCGRTEYVMGSYLDPFGEGRFDAAIMISQDYGVPSPENRSVLLKNIHRALKPGGCFAFDVPGMAAFRRRMDGAAPKWFESEGGFWRANRHIVLEDTEFYPESSALCDRYIVLDEGGVKTYRVWQTFFTPEAIEAELREGGFRMEAILSSLRGDAFDIESPEMGVLCRRG